MTPTAPPPGWSAEKMAALGALHAESEGRGELEPLLATLVAEPEYEFYPARLRMRGGDTVRRFYTQFCERFLPMREDVRLVAEWVSEQSVAQEYEISLRTEAGVEHFHVVGILWADGDKLGGERVYASERFVELMTGPLFQELEPIP